MQGAPNPYSPSGRSFVSKIRIPGMERCIITPDDVFSCFARARQADEALRTYQSLVDGVMRATGDLWDSTEFTAKTGLMKRRTFRLKSEDDSGSRITAQVGPVNPDGYILIRIYYFLRPEPSNK
jgi:hypothetical protein